MAGPHVAGAVALVLSAVPSLDGNVDGIESRLANSAVRNATNSTAPCGSVAGVYPNNLWGFGRLDAACGVAGAPLSAVNVNVAGSTVIGAPAPCIGGTATATDTGGGPGAHQWGYRTVSGGAIAGLSGPDRRHLPAQLRELPVGRHLLPGGAHDAAAPEPPWCRTRRPSRCRRRRSSC